VPKSELSWRPNPSGVVRATLRDILDVGRRNDVDVDGDLYEWVIDEHDRVPADAWAVYGPDLVYARDAAVPWHRYETARGSGRVRVRLSKRLGASDDEILAVLIHETDEVAALEQEFAENGWQLMASRIDSLLNPRNGRLHCAAWQRADEVILGLIEKGVRPR
jgi:hypothetical protein